MQSSGGLTDGARVPGQGRDPVRPGRRHRRHGAHGAGWPASTSVIGFDMGGTSTDVSHLRRRVTSARSRPKSAGVRMRAPMMSIHTSPPAAARSCTSTARASASARTCAGANPGPASYRRGGPLTVTDGNVMLGKLQPRHFPRLFGPGGDQPLDADVVRAGFAALAGEIAPSETARAIAPEAVAEGFLAHRGRQHGQRDQADLGAARL